MTGVCDTITRWKVLLQRLSWSSMCLIDSLDISHRVYLRVAVYDCSCGVSRGYYPRVASVKILNW